MSAETTPRRGWGVARVSSSLSYATPSALKMSTTAGNHFFFSIWTTFSQWACCWSLKRSSSSAATGGSALTLHSSK
eukprot:scaffold75957_cov28-Tisochrysis_lutea.AAC.1